jgi:molybdenum-dependent DNA-binding transcriptional regulator ModE
LISTFILSIIFALQVVFVNYSIELRYAIRNHPDFFSMTLTLEKVAMPLTGKELVEQVKKLGSLSRRDKSIHCGYEKMTDFIDALLEAKGIELDATTVRTKGKSPSGKATVQQNGQIIIGNSYTRDMGLNAGDTFSIKLGSKHIHLIQDES